MFWLAAGLYSGVIAYLAVRQGKAVLYWNEEIIQAEIFTAKKSREFMYTSMERIFSILLNKEVCMFVNSAQNQPLYKLA